VNAKIVSLDFPSEGLTTGVAVTVEGDGLYRLQEHPLFSESAKYGDLIRCKVLGDDHLEFQEVVEASKLELSASVLAADLLDSVAVHEVLAKVMSSGGYWQRDMGGCLTVLFDPNFYDPTFDLDKAILGRVP
jgi:hypothetical protein